MDTRSNEDVLLVVADQVHVGMSGECEDRGKVVVTVGGGEYASEEDSVAADVTGVDDMDTTEIADDKNSVDTEDDVGVVNEQDAHVIQVPYKEETMPEVAKEAEVNWSALEVIDDTDVIGNGVLVLIGVPAWVEVMIVELERMVLERSYGMKL